MRCRTGGTMRLFQHAPVVFTLSDGATRCRGVISYMAEGERPGEWWYEVTSDAGIYWLRETDLRLDSAYDPGDSDTLSR
jgi:hypothetical protein